ncbi:MAG: ATP-binding protein, partial [Actinobacteria bacterium]|nr:ATP-binding protein [Actinomycetota bacterium]
GYRVYYTTAADLVARTSRAALEGRWQTTMRFWNGPAVLVIDLGQYRDYAATLQRRDEGLRSGDFSVAEPARLSA